MSNEQRGRPRGPRQLTIGECIAMARYAPAVKPPGAHKVDATELLAFCDRLEVCTTCGWSRKLHTQVDGGDRLVNMCAHWTRDL